MRTPEVWPNSEPAITWARTPSPSTTGCACVP
ncbi:Uncharacterised protein [Bordetella pertussis]|nr:Uncharacterised protein [Bordetella pertussis]